jgi:hypothetical protein
MAYLADGFGGLHTLRILQHDFNTLDNVGQSLAVDGEDDIIARARLIPVNVPLISWELSVNGGDQWSIVTAGEWKEFTMIPGGDLLWRSTHSFLGSENPSVMNLSIEWLNQYGRIASIDDIPDDQGGWVRLNFNRSGYDFAGEDIYPVIGYQVYRRIDDREFAPRVVEEGKIPSKYETQETMLESFDPEVLRVFEGRKFLLGGSNARDEIPPGTWEIVGSIYATQQEHYTIALPTLADSTEEGGTAWSVYFTTTHTSFSEIWFASHPDSGYSVDNIAPAVPANLIFSEPGFLAWDEPAEPDFSYHSVYGSESGIFDGTAVLIGYTIEPGYDVSGTDFAYYHVTTSDDAGNESGAASIEAPSSTTPDGNPFPSRIAFGASMPNPFRTQTSLTFALPASETVHLAILDAAGRRVRVLVNGRSQAGRHLVSWDGKNANGRDLAPGIYFARFRAGDYEVSRRLVKLR